MNNMRNTYNKIYYSHKVDEEPSSQKQEFFFPEKEQAANSNGESLLDTHLFEKQEKVEKPYFSSKTVSVPFILTPPKVEDRQIAGSIEQPARKIEENPMSNQPKLEKVKGQYDKGKKGNIPQKIKAMLTPFAPMLSWTPSLPSTFSNRIYNKTGKTTGQESFELGAALVEEEAFQSLKGKTILKASDFEEHCEPLSESPDNPKHIEHRDLFEEFSSILDDPIETKSDQLDKSDESFSYSVPFKLHGENKKNRIPLPADDIELLSEGEILSGKESQDEGLRLEESSSGINHYPVINKYLSLENEFLSMLEESSSSESDILSSKQDEVFSLLAENSFSGIESSSLPEKEDFIRNEMFYEESSSSMNEKVFFGKDQTIIDEKDFGESSSFEGEFSIVLEKAYCLLQELVGKKVKTSLTEGTLPQKNEVLSTLKEFCSRATGAPNHVSAADQENAGYQKGSSLLEKFYEMLENTHSSENPEPSLEYSAESSEKDSWKKSHINEKISTELELSDKHAASNENFEESSFCIHEESASMCRAAKKLIEEEDKSLPCHHFCSEPFKTGPIIKVPVLVAKSDVEIDLFDRLPGYVPAKTLKQLEWSVKGLKCRTLLPSNAVFIKGELMTDIALTNNGAMQLLKVPVFFEKTIDLEWLCPPIIPEPNGKREYMFQTESQLDFHNEFFQHFTEEIFCKLQSMHVIWHDEIGTVESLEIQGSVILSIDFLQEQYVRI
ncbi:hypothetical protein GCM10009865_00860 [Aeromicrobium ponti]|uniref:Uncharacterized protein n=1 Tax=Cytobacillus oceanisediminis TaxID=665099 RepID=A0A562JAW8_9BACI|nr:hypothetical protein [Cytobacillus oceanisediminis]TWH80094.1 hypothetical protein IQ19_04810 [Cytobacillus oceanisediminis]